MNEDTSLSPRSNMTLILIALVGVFILGGGTGIILTLLFVNTTPSSHSTNTGGEIPSDGSAEAGFARDMMVHHAQAVNMAEIVRNRTEDEHVRNLAIAIARSQQGEIGQMRGWLQAWGLSTTGSDPAMRWMEHPTEGRMPGMASPEEIESLREAPPEEMDALFLQLMIPHHQAALPMAKAVLERTDRPEVEQFAMGVDASQQKEINRMEWMLQNMGSSLPEEPDMNMEGHEHHNEGSSQESGGHSLKHDA